MAKTFALQPLVELTEHQHEEATRKLGELNQKQQNSQSQLDMLLQYRQEYQSRLAEASRKGITPATLRNYEQFIHKLDEAIQQQTQAVERSKAAVAQGRAHYTTVQQKRQSYQTLHQRYLQAEHRMAEKLEQKLTDEHAGRSTAQSLHHQQN